MTVATYPDYASAARVVDYLSDNNFPVDRVTIVGTDLKLVERVTGRMNLGKAALAGLASGAWLGLLLGLLLGIFAVDDWWRVVLFGVILGAFWGAILWMVAHALTRGQRDFSSYSALAAGEYAVTVDTDVAGEARDLIARMTL